MGRMNSLVAVAGVMLLGVAIASPAATTISTSNRWAWSSSAGWLNCRTDSTNGISVSGYVLSGYMYSPTVGWVNLGNGNPTNGIRYTNLSSTDYGVNHDGKGHLKGFAWNESVGWISFEWTNDVDAVQAPKLNLQNGVFSGYAWSTGLGWVSLSNLSARLQTVSMATGTDGNSNSIPDAWEYANVGTTTNGTNCLAAYIADTCPTNPADVFETTSLLSGTNGITLHWNSKKTRFYYVDMKTNLLQAAWQTNIFGLISSDTDSYTVRVFANPGTQGFFRIRAVLPLWVP